MKQTADKYTVDLLEAAKDVPLTAADRKQQEPQLRVYMKRKKFDFLAPLRVEITRRDEE